MFMALVTSLVVLFYCCVTADILTKLLQQCFLILIVVPWLYLGNSQVSVYRTIGPTLVFFFFSKLLRMTFGDTHRTCEFSISLNRTLYYMYIHKVPKKMLKPSVFNTS